MEYVRALRNEKKWLWLLVVACACVLPERVADAQERKRVVLMDIDGKGGSSLRRQISDLIDRNHAVLPGSAYEKISRRRRLTKINAANIRRVCRDMGCDAVIIGTLSRTDGGYIFVLQIREAITGQVSKKIPMRLRKPRLSRALARGLKTRLLDAIDELDSVGVQEPGGRDDSNRGSSRRDDEDEEIRLREARIAERRKRQKELERERERELEKPLKDRDRDRGRDKDSKRRSTRDFEEDLDIGRDRDRDRDRDDRRDWDRDDRDRGRDRDRDLDLDRDRRRPDRGRRGDDLDLDDDLRNRMKRDPRDYPFSASFGASFQQRQLIFNARPELVGDQVPTPYQGSFAPAATFNGELYPFAFMEDASSGLRGLGIGVHYDRVFGLQVQSGNNISNAFQQRFEAGIRYRINFGTRSTLPSITASLYYGQLAFLFLVDDQQMLDVPNVTYSAISPGLALRIPFSSSFALLAEGKVMGVLSAGDIQLENEYGAGRIVGFDADAGLEITIKNHFLIRGGARLTFVDYAFDGSGDKTERDGVAPFDVGGARDQYLGGYFTFGYRY